MARTSEQLTDQEITLIQALDALSTSGASQAIQKTSATTFANVSVGGTLSQAKDLFPVSSATTFVTLSQTPSAGAVVQISYQGELIYESKAWSRSATTITLLGWTPEDNTFLEAIYNY